MGVHLTTTMTFWSFLQIFGTESGLNGTTFSTDLTTSSFNLKYVNLVPKVVTIICENDPPCPNMNRDSLDHIGQLK